MKAIICFLSIALFYNTKGEVRKLPPYITPCDYNQLLSNCVEKQIKHAIPHFTKGVPELNVPSLDPLYMEDVQIDGNGLTLTFTHMVMEGLRTTKVLSFELDLEKEQYRLVIISNVTINAKYKMDGKILVLPITGEGNSKVDLYNSQIDMTAKFLHFKDASGEHFKQTYTDYKHKVENVKFDFTNLFNGNKQLAEITLNFANENWKTIMEDLAPPVVRQTVKASTKAINYFFSKFPISGIIKGYNKKT